MPIEQKVIKVGNSRAVTIPAGWLEYYEKKLGRPITFVLIELNNVITISVQEDGEDIKEKE